LPARRHLKDKEARQLLKEFIDRYPAAETILKSAEAIEELPLDGNTVVFVDNKPLILRTQTELLPSLKFDELVNSLPKIVVDMGAVSHVANGAHIMRPGVREIKAEFAPRSLVIIVDEKYGKALALGRADMDSDSIRSQSKGKVVANLHYVGDEFWKSFTA
jgi:PUA domain protein